MRGLPKFSGGPITPNFKLITQHTRLTLVCDDPKVVHQIMVSTMAIIVIEFNSWRSEEDISDIEL